MFSPAQMYQIRIGFEQDLSVEQVSAYADPDYTWTQMAYMRKDLELGIPIEEVQNAYRLSSQVNEIEEEFGLEY